MAEETTYAQELASDFIRLNEAKEAERIQGMMERGASASPEVHTSALTSSDISSGKAYDLDTIPQSLLIGRSPGEMQSLLDSWNDMAEEGLPLAERDKVQLAAGRFLKSPEQREKARKGIEEGTTPKEVARRHEAALTWLDLYEEDHKVRSLALLLNRDVGDFRDRVLAEAEGADDSRKEVIKKAFAMEKLLSVNGKLPAEALAVLSQEQEDFQNIDAAALAVQNLQSHKVGPMRDRVVSLTSDPKTGLPLIDVNKSLSELGSSYELKELSERGFKSLSEIPAAERRAVRETAFKRARRDIENSFKAAYGYVGMIEEAGSVEDRRRQAEEGNFLWNMATAWASDKRVSDIYHPRLSELGDNEVYGWNILRMLSTFDMASPYAKVFREHLLGDESTKLEGTLASAMATAPVVPETMEEELMSLYHERYSFHDELRQWAGMTAEIMAKGMGEDEEGAAEIREKVDDSAFVYWATMLPYALDPLNWLALGAPTAAVRGGRGARKSYIAARSNKFLDQIDAARGSTNDLEEYLATVAKSPDQGFVEPHNAYVLNKVLEDGGVGSGAVSPRRVTKLAQNLEVNEAAALKAREHFLENNPYVDADSISGLREVADQPATRALLNTEVNQASRSLKELDMAIDGLGRVIKANKPSKQTDLLLRRLVAQQEKATKLGKEILESTKSTPDAQHFLRLKTALANAEIKGAKTFIYDALEVAVLGKKTKAQLIDHLKGGAGRLGENEWALLVSQSGKSASKMTKKDILQGLGRLRSTSGQRKLFWKGIAKGIAKEAGYKSPAAALKGLTKSLGDGSKTLLSSWRKLNVAIGKAAKLEEGAPDIALYKLAKAKVAAAERNLAGMVPKQKVAEQAFRQAWLKRAAVYADEFKKKAPQGHGKALKNEMKKLRELAKTEADLRYSIAAKSWKKHSQDFVEKYRAGLDEIKARDTGLQWLTWKRGFQDADVAEGAFMSLGKAADDAVVAKQADELVVETDDALAVASEMEEALRGMTTARQACAWLVASTKTPAFREIAKRILPYIDSKVSLHVASVGGKATKHLHVNNPGIFLTTTQGKKTLSEAIWLKGTSFGLGASGMSERTLLHELIHAATMSRIRAGKNAKIGTPLYAARQELKKVFVQIKKAQEEARLGVFGPEASRIAEDFRFPGGPLRSEEELIAYGLTDSSFQTLLKAIKTDSGQTYWSKFVASVKSLLGLEGVDDTALEAVLRATDQLLEAPLPATAATAAKGTAVTASRRAMTAPGTGPSIKIDGKKLAANLKGRFGESVYNEAIDILQKSKVQQAEDLVKLLKEGKVVSMDLVEYELMQGLEAVFLSAAKTVRPREKEWRMALLILQDSWEIGPLAKGSIGKVFNLSRTLAKGSRAWLSPQFAQQASLGSTGEKFNRILRAGENLAERYADEISEVWKKAMKEGKDPTTEVLAWADSTQAIEITNGVTFLNRSKGLSPYVRAHRYIKAQVGKAVSPQTLKALNDLSLDATSLAQHPEINASLLALSRIFVKGGGINEKQAARLYQLALKNMGEETTFAGFLKKQYGSTQGVVDNASDLVAFSDIKARAFALDAIAHGAMEFDLLAIANREMMGVISQKAYRDVDKLFRGGHPDTKKGSADILVALDALAELGRPAFREFDTGQMFTRKGVQKNTQSLIKVSAPKKNPELEPVFLPHMLMKKLDSQMGGKVKQIQRHHIQPGFTGGEYLSTGIRKFANVWKQSVTSGLILPNPKYHTWNRIGDWSQMMYVFGIKKATQATAQNIWTDIPWVGRKIQDTLVSQARKFKGGPVLAHPTQVMDSPALDLLWRGEKGFVRLGDRVETLSSLRRQAVEDGILDTHLNQELADIFKAHRPDEIPFLKGILGPLHPNSSWNDNIQRFAISTQQRQRLGTWYMLQRQGMGRKEATKNTLDALFDWKHGTPETAVASWLAHVPFARFFHLAARHTTMGFLEPLTEPLPQFFARSLKGDSKLTRLANIERIRAGLSEQMFGDETEYNLFGLMPEWRMPGSPASSRRLPPHIRKWVRENRGVDHTHEMGVMSPFTGLDLLGMAMAPIMMTTAALFRMVGEDRAADDLLSRSAQEVIDVLYPAQRESAEVILASLGVLPETNYYNETGMVRISGGEKMIWEMGGMAKPVLAMLGQDFVYNRDDGQWYAPESFTHIMRIVPVLGTSFPTLLNQTKFKNPYYAESTGAAVKNWFLNMTGLMKTYTFDPTTVLKKRLREINGRIDEREEREYFKSHEREK